MTTLLESLTSLAAPAVGQIATRLGETDASVTRGVQASFASVLGGIITRANDPGALHQIANLVSARPVAAALPVEVESALGELSRGIPTSGPAGTFLGILFGARPNAVGDLVAGTAGFQNASSGASLLGMAAPLVLGFLARNFRGDGMNVGGLTTTLAGERDGILAAAPPGLMDVLAGTSPAGRAGGARRGAGAGADAPGGHRWIWPIVGIALVAVAAWFIAARRRAPAAGPSIGTGAAKVPTEELAGGAEEPGALVMRTLPSGVTIRVPARGTESRLIAFIEDRSRPVDDTTWFDFDRVTFTSGSTAIQPQSREQLRNVAAVLQAYPDVNVKVGGYTDNVGSAAANLRLSRRRADAVRQALIGSGIPARRLQAEGYGESHPVADNASEEGRARNRRIALRVTKK